jgi:hypothetical protein
MEFRRKGKEKKKGLTKQIHLKTSDLKLTSVKITPT